MHSNRPLELRGRPRASDAYQFSLVYLFRVLLKSSRHFRLQRRRELWHHDCCRNAEQLALISECLSMIARRSCDDSALLLFLRQLSERVACAAFLKTSGPLQVIQLAENFGPRQFAQRNRGQAWRVVNRIRNAFSSRLDVLKCDQAC